MADTTPQPTLTDTAQPSATQVQMRNEIATIDKVVYDALFYGGNLKLLINGDDVLKSRGGARGLAIYDDLERDAHCGSVMDKRKRAVTAREWCVQPASKDAADQETASFVEGALKALRFDKLTKELLDAVLKGFAVVELVWGVVDNRIVPVRFVARDQRRFVFDIERRPRLITREHMMDGELLPDRKFIVHSVGGKDGSPYGLGIGRRLFWPVFFKRQTITFWLVFADKFSSPSVLGKYPGGASEEEQSKLLASLRSISHDAGIIVPEGMEVTLLEASRSSASDFYELLCKYMDAEISKAVLGETLTTEVGSKGGNRALGDVHNEVREELAKDDADDLSATLNDTLVKWLVDLNFPGRAYPSVWRRFEEAEDMDKVADRDTKLKLLGWERTEESFLETYGEGYMRVQQPSHDANTLAPGGSADLTAGAADNSAASFSEAGLFARFKQWLGFAEPTAVERQRARKHADQETISQGADKKATEWESLLGYRVNELQTVLDETGDLALFSERLQEMINNEPDQKLVDALSRATFASHLAGRSSRGK